MSESKSHILVVDDNANNRDLIQRRLERAGYEVALAEDGSVALDRLARESFDLVILDVMMPGISGTEVLRILRRDYSQVQLPIIMATAKDQSEDIVGALDLGANDYVTKPIDFPVLLARIHSQLKARETAAAAAPTQTKRLHFTELKPGLLIDGKYRLEEEIGSGNFGAVYRATHLSFEEPVALKVLKTAVDDTDEEDLLRFRQEGASAMRLQHPHAVSIMDFTIAHGLAILVMELLSGQSLDDLLKAEKRLAPSRALEVILPVCEVLTEADNLGIVHRDIKPANIFLHQTRRGETIKVLDFGIAKITSDAGHNLTLDEGILGTPAYMSPERLHGRPYDGRSDVYSLGVMLYQMLAGCLPFRVHGNDAMAIAVQHLTAAPTLLREHLPDVPLHLEAVIMSTLKKDPEERPRAAELATRLVEAIESSGIHVRPEIIDSVPIPQPSLEDATQRMDQRSTSRLSFDFSDLLSPPPSRPQHPPLPVKGPRRLGEPWDQ